MHPDTLMYVEGECTVIGGRKVPPSRLLSMQTLTFPDVLPVLSVILDAENLVKRRQVSGFVEIYAAETTKSK